MSCGQWPAARAVRPCTVAAPVHALSQHAQPTATAAGCAARCRDRSLAEVIAFEQLAQALHVVDTGSIGIVRTEYDLRDRHHFGQRGHGDRVGGLRRVVVEAPELGHHAVEVPLVLVLRHRRKLRRETLGQRRDRAAAVAEDPVDVLGPLRRAARTRGSRSCASCQCRTR